MDVRTFLSRQLDSTRVNRSAAGALRRLDAADVCIVGGGSLAELLAADLAATGFGRVRCAPEVLPGTTLAIGLGAPGVVPDFAALDDDCARMAIAWLRVVLEGHGVAIGPRFDRTDTPCLRCADAASAPERAPAGRDLDAAGRDALVAGFVGVQVTHAIARVGARITSAAVTHIDLENFAQRVIPVARRPGCPHCSPEGGGAIEPVSLGHAYEQSVAFPPRELLDPKDHQQHYKPANVRLQRSSKHYPGARRTALEPFAESPAATGDGLDRATLAGLLARSFGLRDRLAAAPGGSGKVERWAPTGGNLGSTQAYPLIADVAGLDPGAYFYLAHEHELALLPNSDPLTATTLGAATREDFADAAAIVVLTGALERVAGKYGTFGYRIVNLDAGCAVAQLALAATARGLEVRVASRWNDDALGEALRITLDSEPVTAVVALGRTGAAHA